MFHNVPNDQKPQSMKCYERLSDNVSFIKQLLGNPVDLMIKEVIVQGKNLHCAVVYIDGLVDKNLINNEITKNIQLGIRDADLELFQSSDVMVEQLQLEVISSYVSKVTENIEDVVANILSGDTAIFVDGSRLAILVDTKGWKERSLNEPRTESVVRGSLEGFVENITTNLMLIRRRIRDTRLRFVHYKLGQRSHQDVVLVYMEGITNPKIIEEITRRLLTYDIDDLINSGALEQWIQDSYLSIFPQVLNSERPDKVAAAILQGKVAIFVDGTPFVLTAPVIMGNLLHSPEDYDERWIISTLIRLLRYGAAFMAVFLPALYIALVSYHPGMIPSDLAFSIAGSREGVPFPAIIEAFVMEATLELLREAGIRLPKPVGQTIGIVGGLVIGEAAVIAGIVSPIMVIIVAITAIASFALPSYNYAISLRIARFGLMAGAAIFGFLGIILGYIMINIHLSNLKSFGIPYTAPFSPFFPSDWKDLIIRAPRVAMSTRPEYLKPQDKDRMSGGEQSS